MRTCAYKITLAPGEFRVSTIAVLSAAFTTISCMRQMIIIRPVPVLASTDVVNTDSQNIMWFL